MTATLSGPSSEAAGADDFTLSTAATLTFAANATTSAGLVTANGNAVDSPNKFRFLL